MEPLIKIAREGPSWVVIDKPAGMLSVPGKGPEKQDCAALRARAMFPEASGPLIVHRLDMDTSGLMVLGLTPEAQRELSGQFERREVAKTYIALVEGGVERDEGVIDLPMRLDVENRPHQVIDFAQGKPSATKWRVLSREIDRTRLELLPETGRTHQLRVHCAAAREVGGLGHCIVGDVLYGLGVQIVGRVDEARRHKGTEARSGEESRDSSPPSHCSGTSPPRGEESQRLMLHASWLRFRCPESEKWVEVESGAPF